MSLPFRSLASGSKKNELCKRSEPNPDAHNPTCVPIQHIHIREIWNWRTFPVVLNSDNDDANRVLGQFDNSVLGGLQVSFVQVSIRDNQHDVILLLVLKHSSRK
jgi:hypothetical protein